MISIPVVFSHAYIEFYFKIDPIVTCLIAKCHGLTNVSAEENVCLANKQTKTKKQKTNNQSIKQTNKQTKKTKQINKQTNKQINKQTNNQTNIYTNEHKFISKLTPL